MRALANDQQRAAIDARGSVFVAAGAGTGKTAVLVERFVRAVAEDGLDVDSLLVITYTERAAGELRARIRSALVERGRSDLALELDGAWVSTIHGFCRRILGAYPLAAGSTPRSACSTSRRRSCSRRGVLDGARGVLRGRRAGPVAAARDLRRRGAPSDARGRVRDTPLGRAGARARVGSAGAAARAGPRRSATPRWLSAMTRPRRCAACGRRRGARARRRDDAPQRLLALADPKTRGPRAAGFAETRDAVVAAALEELAARDRELLQELLTTFASAYGAAKERESALDFEDLQLRARDLLRDDEAIRERERRGSARSWSTSSRTRTGSRPSCSTCSARGRTPTSSSSATSSSRSTASAMPTSPYSGNGGARGDTSSRSRGTTGRVPRYSTPSTSCSAASSATSSSGSSRPRPTPPRSGTRSSSS